MAENTNPSPETQTAPAGGEGKVDSSVGSPNPLNDFLGKLGEVSGTQYKSPDDVVEHVKNLNKFVGDQTIAQARKDAERWSEVSKHLLPEAVQAGFDDPYDYVKFLTENRGSSVSADEWKQKQSTLIQKKEEEQRSSKFEKELNEIKDKLTQKEFAEKFGATAAKYFKGVQAFASAEGINDVFLAYEKSPFKELVEADRTKEATSVVENNRNAGPNTADYEKDIVQAIETGNWLSFLNKHKGLEVKK